MTVATNPPYDQYIATGGQTVFNYTFEIVENTDLLVYQRLNTDAPNDLLDLLTFNVDYTVTGVGAENGGTVVLGTGATLNDIVTIKQNVPVGRDTAFTPGGILRAQDLNSEFDNQTLIGQVSRFNEQSRMLRYWDSAIVVPYVDTILPVLGANQVWAKNNANDAIIAYTVPEGGLGVNNLEGTQYQVLVNGTFGIPQVGNLILTLPQDIAPTSSPTFAALTVPTFYDANGLPAFTIQTVASQVNYLSVYPQPTGSGPTFAALGSDTDIDLNFLPKGDGSVQILSSNPTNPLIITNGTLGQHVTNFIMANTAAARSVTFQDASGTLAFLSDIPAFTPAALTATPDTNVTISLGGTPATALLQAASITLGWTGQLAVSRGGTGISSFGTGVATALGVNVGSAGAFVTFNGAGGTPSSINLTNGTALPVPAGLTATGTPSSTTFLRGDGTWATPGGAGTVTSVATGGLATGGPITGTGTVTVTAATQSDQETATSTTTAVTPAVQKFHPSSCKFWMNLHGTDTFGINQSYNVSSATDGGVGTYSYNITVAFSAATQCLVVNAFSASGSSNNYSVGTTSWATGSGGISLRNMAGTLVDSDNVCIAGFGDQ